MSETEPQPSQENERWEAALANDQGPGWVVRRPGARLTPTIGYDSEDCCGILSEADARLIAAAPELLERLKIEHDEAFHARSLLGLPTPGRETCPTCAVVDRAEGRKK